MYSPAWGRFLQADPLRTRVSTNLYQYANNTPLNQVDPFGKETLQIGVAGSINIPALGISIPLGFGITVDTRFNVGTYVFGGVGLQAGANVDADFSFQYSNAKTIYDLSGRFDNFSLHGGAGFGGSLDYFQGSSPNGFVRGGGVTFGLSAGASASVATTGTVVCGSEGCVGSPIDAIMTDEPSDGSDDTRPISPPGPQSALSSGVQPVSSTSGLDAGIGFGVNEIGSANLSSSSSK